jgi:Rod binding domain-containing protein
MPDALAAPAAALQPRPAADPDRIRRAARDFEAQALGALLAPMFEGLRSSGPFTGGAGEAQWRPMLVDAIARDLARAGGLGLATAVEREMLRLQEARTPPTGEQSP